MTEPKILKLDEIESRPLFGSEGFHEGWIKRIVYHPYVDTKKVYVGMLEVNPGFYAHRWHTHTSDRSKDSQLVFSEDYLEIYHLVSGRGTVQWKNKDGRIEERTAVSGDTIYFPVGMPEHQFINSGTEKIRLIIVGVPAPQVTFFK